MSTFVGAGRSWRARQCGDLGLDRGKAPLASEEPTTRPPHDAAARERSGGEYVGIVISARVIVDGGGVRPNSPQATTSVVSSRPRCFKSSSEGRIGQVVEAGRNPRRSESKPLTWVSQSSGGRP